MEKDNNTYNKLLGENELLRMQLEEANDAIHAIRTGQVDAFVLETGGERQLFTLKTADQTYRVFIEKMNEGAVTLNRDGLILYSNSRFAEMVGVPLEKVLGLSFNGFVPETSREKFDKLINSGWEQDCKEEILLENSDNRLVPCLLSCNALELDEGMALSLILTDLTMLKEAERQLQTKNEQLEIARAATEKLNDELEDTVNERTRELLISREHLSLLLNNISQMSWTNLPDGEVNFYNRQWYDYTGLSFNETKAWGWQDVVHPDDVQETVKKYRAALQSGNMFEIENRYKKADGAYRWFLNRVNPCINETGDILFWVGTATDIEDQKKAMDKKDEFIGIASHELKTPLTSLKGYLQLLASYKREELPPAVKMYIEKANSSMNKLQNLVNDLLDVSKIQAGRLEYKLDKLDLSALIASWVENAEHIYPNSNFDNQAQDNFWIEGNAERLEQVLMNLINNAVKYSTENKDIIVRTSRQGDKVRISVTDFGIGLSGEQIDRIFERFYRVEDKKFMAGGLGMGLYISAEIVNAHNGNIGVESTPGQGSTFYFDLPLIEA